MTDVLKKKVHLKIVFKILIQISYKMDFKKKLLRILFIQTTVQTVHAIAQIVSQQENSMTWSTPDGKHRCECPGECDSAVRLL